MSRPDRIEQLARELRGARPTAPSELRERVRLVAAREPEARPARPRFALPRFAPRRTALAFAALIIAGALGYAGLHGIVSADDPQGAARQSRPGVVVSPARPEGSEAGMFKETLDATRVRSALPPTRGRLQNYQAFLQLRVRDEIALAEATQAAMRLTRRLGGYIVSSRFDTAGAEAGGSFLVVRVPVRRVQEALVRFGELGTLTGQRISIDDLTGQVERRRTRIDALRRDIDRLQDLLRDPGLAADARARLVGELTRDRQTLRVLLRRQQTTVARARLARIELALTTRTVEQAQPPGRLERTLDDAASTLERELAWALYALIVVGPPLAVLVLALALGRVWRRREEDRLLARA